MSGYELLTVMAGRMAVTSAVDSVTKASARRAEARRTEARRPGLPSETGGRPVRIEQAVEAIAMKVERVSEGQGYTTKLLAERAADEAPMRAGRFDAR